MRVVVSSSCDSVPREKSWNVNESTGRRLLACSLDCVSENMDFRDLEESDTDAEKELCPSCELPYELQTTKSDFFDEKDHIVFCEKYGKIYIHER